MIQQTVITHGHILKVRFQPHDHIQGFLVLFSPTSPLGLLEVLVFMCENSKVESLYIFIIFYLHPSMRVLLENL